MDWFLYDRDLRHKKVSDVFSRYRRSFLKNICVKHVNTAYSLFTIKHKNFDKCFLSHVNVIEETTLKVF